MGKFAPVVQKPVYRKCVCIERGQSLVNKYVNDYLSDKSRILFKRIMYENINEIYTYDFHYPGTILSRRYDLSRSLYPPGK